MRGKRRRTNINVIRSETTMDTRDFNFEILELEIVQRVERMFDGLEDLT